MELSRALRQIFPYPSNSTSFHSQTQSYWPLHGSTFTLFGSPRDHSHPLDRHIATRFYLVRNWGLGGLRPEFNSSDLLLFSSMNVPNGGDLLCVIFRVFLGQVQGLAHSRCFNGEVEHTTSLPELPLCHSK